MHAALRPDCFRFFQSAVAATLIMGLATPLLAAPASGPLEADGYQAGVDGSGTPGRTGASERVAGSEDASGPGFHSSHWPQLGKGLQLDEDQEPATGKLGEAVTAWSDFRYAFVAGSSMLPRSSATSWTYAGAGCMSAGVGNDIFVAHLDLPSGARIDYLRLFFYDTSASESTAWITIYDGAGQSTDLTTLNSTSDTGYGTTLSTLIEHVVDTVSSSYVLNWRPNQTGTSMRLCGLRVAYREPL